LGEDVAHTGALEHRAHGAAGDDAGPGRGGLQEHAPGAVVTDDFMRDGRARERDLDQAAAGGFDGLAYRLAHLVRFAGGDPDAPCPSPTATSALKPKRRPPFTTFATRLMEMTFSTSPSPSPCRSLESRRSPPRAHHA